MLAALLDTLDALLAPQGDASILLAYKSRSAVVLEDMAFFGPAAERFTVSKTSLRPYESDANAAAVNDGRLCVYEYRRARSAATLVTSTAPSSKVAASACIDGEPLTTGLANGSSHPWQPLATCVPADAELSAMLSGIGLAHLGEALRDEQLRDLAQAVLDDRPALLARLRGNGISKLSDRQKVANELTRAARERGLTPAQDAGMCRGVKRGAAAASLTNSVAALQLQ